MKSLTGCVIVHWYTLKTWQCSRLLVSRNWIESDVRPPDVEREADRATPSKCDKKQMCNCCCPVSSCLTVKTIGKATSWRKRPNLFLSFSLLFFLLCSFSFLVFKPFPPRLPERGLVKKATHTVRSLELPHSVFSHRLVARLSTANFYSAHPDSFRLIRLQRCLVSRAYSYPSSPPGPQPSALQDIGSTGTPTRDSRTHLSGRFGTTRSV